MVPFERSLVYQWLMHVNCPMVRKQYIGSLFVGILLLLTTAGWGRPGLMMYLSESDTAVEAQVVCRRRLSWERFFSLSTGIRLHWDTVE